MQATDTSEVGNRRIDERVLRSNQRLLKNFIFNRIYAYFASIEDEGLTQRSLADRIGMDYGRLNKLLRAPSNLTLETISDLLSAMNATIGGFPIVPSKLEERSSSEFLADFLAENQVCNILQNQIKQYEEKNGAIPTLATSASSEP